MQVRLGTQPDLKIDDPLLKHFQALSPDSALRLVSRTPSDLPTFFGPILPSEFLEEAELLGLELTLAVPAKAHLIVTASDAAKAKELGRRPAKRTGSLARHPRLGFRPRHCGAESGTAKRESRSALRHSGRRSSVALAAAGEGSTADDTVIVILSRRTSVVEESRGQTWSFHSQERRALTIGPLFQHGMTGEDAR